MKLPHRLAGTTSSFIFSLRYRLALPLFVLVLGIAAFQIADRHAASVEASPGTLGAGDLTVTPLTWNIVGLDSNSPATGPNRFPVGARVCNVGSTGFGNVTAVFSWDSVNQYINLRPGSLASISLGAIGAGSCADAYFEAEIDRTAGSAPVNTSRRYHISATDSVSGNTGSTPLARELFVERLISQNRNGIRSIKLNGTLIPVGGAMTLVVGNTYNIELNGYTATQGYNQLEGFINFPNTIFQVLGVNTTYTADSSPYVTSPSDRLYANGCLWDDDINSPNYKSCIGGDGKAGGTVITTYTVKIVAGGGTSQSLNSLLYDFSGSSFHYNADYGVGFRVAEIVSPASVSMSKTFTPKAIAPGGTSAMTFRLSNPSSETFTGVNFTDTFPAGLFVSGTPNVSYNGCGAGAFSPAPVAGATSLLFSNGTLAPNSACTINVNVTAPAAGTYLNTTGNLFINTSTDTGNFGQDTLTVSTAPACTPGQSLATWTMPTTGQGSGGPPPPFTTKSARVAAATASTSVGMTNSIVTQGNLPNSWGGQGFAKTGVPTGDTAPYFQFAIDTSKYSDVAISLDHFRDTNWGGGGSSVPTLYVYSSTTGANGSYTLIGSTASLTSVWQSLANTPAAATGAATTYFRINAVGTNSVSASQVYIDNVNFSGCGLPLPSPTITKSFNPSTTTKGANSTLTFTLNNTATGNEALTGVAFNDVLPAGLSIANSSTAQCGGTLTTSALTRTIALTGGQLAAGASCNFNVAVTGTNEGSYDNITGYVSSNEGGVSTSYATASLSVIAPPELGKAFSPTSILTGETSTLSFSIDNPNQLSSLRGITFTDPLPAGVTVATSGPTAACGGTLTTTAPSSIAFTGGTLAANGSCTFSVPVTGATSGSKNNITSTISSIEGGSGNAASGSLVVNTPTAVIDLNKQISTNGVDWFKFVGVPTGSDVYYRFAVYNGGDLPFTGISVSDPTLAGSSADPAACTWTVPFAVGDTAFCVTGPVAAVAGSNPNVATASGTHASGTVSSTSSTAIYATTGLTVVKNSAETYFTAAGNVLHYSFLVTNSGFAPLLGPVTVTDDKTTDETCPAVETVGDFDNYLDPGESIVCTATYSVLAADVTARSVTNLAFASVSGTDSNVASKTISLPVDLSISKSSSVKPYIAGEPLTYTIVVTNNGPNNVTGAHVVDLLPAPLADFSWTCSANGAGALCGTAGPVVGDISSFVDLPNGTQAVFTVTGTVPSDTTGGLSNTATVTPPADIVDIVPGNNTAIDNNPGGPLADLSILKSSSPKPYVAGLELTYVITVFNSGPTNVVGATVRDILPAELTGVTWTSSVNGTATVTAGGSGTGNDLSATININSGAGNSVTFTVTGTAPGGATASIVNTATVTPPADITDPVPGNNTATDENPIVRQTDLAITKVSSPNPYVAGSTLTYTVTVTNNGPEDVAGAAVRDSLPAALSGFTWTCWASGTGSCLNANGTGDIDTLVILPSGASATFTITGTVPMGTFGQLINTASVTPPSGTSDPLTTNNSATDETLFPPTSARVTVSGRVATADGYAIRNAIVTVSDLLGNSRMARTSTFGYFFFDDVSAGETYLVSVSAKQYSFTPRAITITDEIGDLNFVADR